MGLKLQAWVVIVAMTIVATRGAAQEPLADNDWADADARVRAAFAFLYALPSDTAGVAMGSWVVDSKATTPPNERTGRWRIAVTKLTDTGQGLKVQEMVGEPGTSPAQLAAAMAAMQQLEGKISKAEAEASLEVVIALNEAETRLGAPSDTALQRDNVVRGAQLARQVRGHWTRVEDRELGITVERWSPATLVVRFGPEATRGIQTIVITAQGNDEMIDRVVKETRWSELAALVKAHQP